MANFDRSLVYRVRKLITGSNVHRIGSWLLCYELSRPKSKQRAHYERLLRRFLAQETAKAAQFINGVYFRKCPS